MVFQDIIHGPVFIHLFIFLIRVGTDSIGSAVVCWTTNLYSKIDVAHNSETSSARLTSTLLKYPTANYREGLIS
jgi:hypothetical protein